MRWTGLWRSRSSSSKGSRAVGEISGSALTIGADGLGLLVCADGRVAGGSIQVNWRDSGAEGGRADGGALLGRWPTEEVGPIFFYGLAWAGTTMVRSVPGLVRTGQTFGGRRLCWCGMCSCGHGRYSGTPDVYKNLGFGVKGLGVLEVHAFGAT